MTPAELRAARDALGMTGKELAAALRMGAHGWQTVSSWENGHKPIPGPVSVAVELLVRVKA